MKLILCCDYGLDDAAATVDMLMHAKSDGYSEVVLVAVGGNVPSDISLRNAKKLLGDLPFFYPETTVIDTTAEKQPCESLTQINGEDGMGDIFAERPEFVVKVVAFADWIETLKRDYVLLSLGPMTLVPRILARGACKKFVFRGGNLAETPDRNGYEFNHALDREAFAEAVKHPHVAITLNTCRHPLFEIQKHGVRGEHLMHRLANRARDLTFCLDKNKCYVYDDIAVKYLRHPDWFETYEATDRDGNRLTVARYVQSEPYAEIIEK